MDSNKAISEMINCFFDEPKDFLYVDEIQELFSNLRLGGTSVEQIKASLRYTSITPDGCEPCELLDVLKELDRRYFMVQDLRWEFSLLDVEKKDTLPLSTAKMLMKMVHKDLFSEIRWERLLQRRPIYDSPITFQEMEVELCNIPFKEKEVPRPKERQPDFDSADPFSMRTSTPDAEGVGPIKNRNVPPESVGKRRKGHVTADPQIVHPSPTVNKAEKSGHKDVGKFENGQGLEPKQHGDNKNQKPDGDQSADSKKKQKPDPHAGDKSKKFDHDRPADTGSSPKPEREGSFDKQKDRKLDSKDPSENLITPTSGPSKTFEDIPGYKDSPKKHSIVDERKPEEESVPLRDDDIDILKNIRRSGSPGPDQGPLEPSEAKDIDRATLSSKLEEQEKMLEMKEKDDIADKKKDAKERKKTKKKLKESEKVKEDKEMADIADKLKELKDKKDKDQEEADELNALQKLNEDKEDDEFNKAKDIARQKRKDERKKKKQDKMDEEERLAKEAEEALRQQQEEKKRKREEERKRLEEEAKKIEEAKLEKVEEPKEPEEAENPMVTSEEEELKNKLKQLEEDERLRREKEAEEAKEVEQVAEDATNEEQELERQIKETEDRLSKTNDPKTRRELEDRLKKLRERLGQVREKRIRYNLKAAIKIRRRPRLEKSVKDFKDERLKDNDGDLKKGERLIKLLKSKEDLLSAMSSRKLEPLEKAIDRIKANGFEEECQPELTQASLLAMRLRRLERIRAEILELKQSTVAEIRSYSSPPIQVHSVMTATFVLLGHTQKECKVWKNIQALVGKTGKMGLKRRCLGLEPKSVKLQVAKASQKLIDQFELDEIRDVSAGAATFYCWAFSIIEEVLAIEDERIKGMAAGATASGES